MSTDPPAPIVILPSPAQLADAVADLGSDLTPPEGWQCKVLATVGLGQANDTPEVLVEIRAAELAALCDGVDDPKERVLQSSSLTEYWGYLDRHGHGLSTPSAEADAGWLAHAIIHHNESES